MVYVVDLDDTLLLTKNLNNDAYNFALEHNEQKRISSNKRITKENLKIKTASTLLAVFFTVNYYIRRCF